MESIYKPVAVRWFKRGNEDVEVRDQFLSYWTAFNALYGSYPELKEGEKILRTVDTVPEEQARKILALPEVQFFANLSPSVRYHDGRTGQLKTTEHQQDRLLQRKDIEPKVALEALMEIMQKIRLNIFSGGPDAVKNEDIIVNAVPIVRGLVEILLAE